MIEEFLREYKEIGSHIEVILPCGRITLISNEDKKYLEIFPYWRYSCGYVSVTRYHKTEYGTAREDYRYHRILLNSPKGFEVDHINRNKLDNRRINLRLASRSENSANKAKAKGTTSIYRGVCYRVKINKKNPWGAYISKNKKRIELGYYPTEHDAALAYNKKSLEIYGDFAFLNEIIRAQE